MNNKEKSPDLSVATENDVGGMMMAVKKAIIRGEATNSGLLGPGSNRDLFCIISMNVV